MFLKTSREGLKSFSKSDARMQNVLKCACVTMFYACCKQTSSNRGVAVALVDVIGKGHYLRAIADKSFRELVQNTLPTLDGGGDGKQRNCRGPDNFVCMLVEYDMTLVQLRDFLASRINYEMPCDVT
jgi:hypothetical protein